MKGGETDSRAGREDDSSTALMVASYERPPRGRGGRLLFTGPVEPEGTTPARAGRTVTREHDTRKLENDPARAGRTPAATGGGAGRGNDPCAGGDDRKQPDPLPT
ncbi:hypothetical protein [Streptomyces amakusaensis]|uniref:Uncharacterized protein n=1 Tax=Streptomyces amakusaensis TaxID=67271 RepID=A0ABW0AU53_9ACTN